LPPAGHNRLIDDIQVLRAVAIACVLLEHSWFNLVFNQPWLTWLLTHVPLWCGVDLFFVISGYVITGSLLPQLLTGGPGRPVLARFWIRRAFRLWPAAWLWLALIVLGSAIFTNPPFLGPLDKNIKGAAAGIFAFANIRFAQHPMEPYGASYPYWSLSLEEQFYIILPPLMLLFRQRIGWLAALALLVQLPLPHPRLYFFLRNDGLLWGVLLAAVPAMAMSARPAAARLAHVPFAGLAVLIVSVGVMSFLSPPLERSPAFLVGAMAAVAAVPVWLAGGNANLFSAGRLQPAALWLGSRSYALYLCHVPVYQCAAALSRRIGVADPIFHAHGDLRSTVIGLAALAAAAECTYRFVERPVRGIGADIASKWPARARRAAEAA
jgi:peptidoglycan/LPS O-acetylase OafA/YrhL